MVCFHKIYTWYFRFLQVRPEPDEEARTVRTTKTPRLAPKAKAKAGRRAGKSWDKDPEDSLAQIQRTTFGEIGQRH